MTNMPRVRLRVRDTNIEVKPTLTVEEASSFAAFLLEWIARSIQEPELLPTLDWALRTATIASYTDYPIDENDIEGLVNFLYGTPLYAMMVGSPEHPVHYSGKAYTQPMIDMEQFDSLVDGLNLLLQKTFSCVENL